MDLSFAHLQAELARIDVLIRREVLRWQLAGQDPTDAFRGLHVSDAEAEMLLARPFGASWGHTVTLEPEIAASFEQAKAQIGHQSQAISKEARRQNQILRLEYLSWAFNLSRFDLDVLLICLAPTLDLRYERLYGYLQDDITRKRPRINLALDLLCGPEPAQRLPYLLRFSDDAPLFKYFLLSSIGDSRGSDIPLLSQILDVDGALVTWLLGGYHPHVELGSAATLTRPHEDDTDALLATDVLSNLEHAADERALVVFYGPDQVRQQAAARLLAARAGRLLLVVNIASVVESGTEPLRAVRLALRDARLTSSILCLSGWDACLVKDGAPPPELLFELCAYPDLVIIAGRENWQVVGIERARRLFRLEFPLLAYGQRSALWQHFLEQPELEEALDVPALAGHFVLTSGQIRDAVAAAKDMAGQGARGLESQDLFSAARIHSNPRLSSLARKIVPRYDWQDIVLPEDQRSLLWEIISTVRARSLVLEEWGVGQKLTSSKGITVLFAGPPGTGKTMAAEILSGELGLDLYKIDLSSIVSKYIGETEKNLERIFNEAESSNAILFFDEADALFGKRSEVKDSHDRYANIEISYLLQRMEAYDGVTILATNLRANLDEAFTRRLQFAVDFPFPEEEDRLRIWQALFPPTVPQAPDLDLALLAKRFRLAGGSIRNVIVSATYLAATDGGQVMMKHLLHGTRRELQKMGRLVREEDLSID